MKIKKLNNKGFTLIELLAVIVILAVVMGIAANSVINSMNNSRKGALKDNVLIVQEAFNTAYVESQVEGAEKIYTIDRKTLLTGIPQNLTAAAITALKMDSNDIDSNNSYVRFDTENETFEVCLAATDTGKFYVASAAKTEAAQELVQTVGQNKGVSIAEKVMFWCTPKFKVGNATGLTSSY